MSAEDRQAIAKAARVDSALTQVEELVAEYHAATDGDPDDSVAHEYLRCYVDELHQRIAAARRAWDGPTSAAPLGTDHASHWQIMGCLHCGLAGEVPEHAFPQAQGLWARDCPQCGQRKVWITDVVPRGEQPTVEVGVGEGG